MTSNFIKNEQIKIILPSLLMLSLFIMTSIAKADFYDNSDGTVTDQGTTLMWQRCSAPSEEASCTSVLPSTYIWDEALAYCNALTLGGYTDWRLPNIKELHSILYLTKTTAPNINTDFFSDTESAYYWSSTTFVGTPSYAWYVNFNIVGSQIAMTSPQDKRNTEYVRCVR